MGCSRYPISLSMHPNNNALPILVRGEATLQAKLCKRQKIDIGVCILVAILGFVVHLVRKYCPLNCPEAQLFGRLTFLSTCGLLVCDLISFLVWNDCENSDVQSGCIEKFWFIALNFLKHFDLKQFFVLVQPGKSSLDNFSYNIYRESPRGPNLHNPPEQK